MDDPNKSRVAKKLLIDLTFLFDQYSKRGIGRTGKEIIKRILLTNEEEKAFEIHLLGFFNIEQNLVQLEVSPFNYDEIKANVFFHSLGKPTPSGINNIFRWSGWYGKLLTSLQPDIFYALHFERGLPTAPIFSKNLKAIPKTAVFYPDAIPLAMENFKFSKKGYIQHLLKKWFYLKLVQGVKNSDLILTCSEFSKQDIVKYLQVDAAKVNSIYLGVDESFYREGFNVDLGEQRTVLGLYQVNDKKYFFYDSGIEANKNVEALIEVLASMQTDESFPNYLVVTGGDFARGIGTEIRAKSPQVNQFLNLAKSKNVLDKIITTGKIPDQHLKYLLFNSNTYINLSTYEGFHLGPLQAMAAEIPAIASNTSCTPEVTKGGAFLIDLENINNAIRKIKEFLKDENLKADYVKRGKKIVKTYNWDDTAKQTWAALKNL